MSQSEDSFVFFNSCRVIPSASSVLSRVFLRDKSPGSYYPKNFVTGYPIVVLTNIDTQFAFDQAQDKLEDDVVCPQ